MRFFTCLFFLLGLAFSSFSQERIISGVVTTKDGGLALPGVSIRISGTDKGTLSDGRGRFKLKVPMDDVMLIFTYIGYVTKEVEAVANYSIVNVELESDQAKLNEVVITGYTAESKSKYTGSVVVVEGSKINQVPMSTIDQILQGRVAGMYTTTGSGQPGSAARITVRGIGTIAGSTQPLFVVDGVPVEALIYYGLNSSDIESVYVLKDATSTALYGSRGSNGVIVVNTKKGKKEDLSLDYSVQTGFSRIATDNFNMLNSAQRIQFEEEVGRENGITIGPGWALSSDNTKNSNLTSEQKAKNAHILDSLRKINFDWRDVFLREGKFQEHQASLQGGNDKVKFYSSANFFDQEGISLRSYLKRYSLRNNLSFNDRRLSGNFNIGLSYSRSSSIEAENSSNVNNAFAAVYYALPYEIPYINGKLYTSRNKLEAPYQIFDLREGSNALEKLLDASSTSAMMKANISSSIKYKITDDLTFSSILGFDFRESNTTRTVTPGTDFGSQSTYGQGVYGESSNRNFQYVLNSGLNYSKSLNEHKISATALFEVNRTMFKGFNYTGYGINPKLLDSPAGITQGTTSSGFIPVVGGSKPPKSALVSFIGIGNYNYSDKYNLSLSYRYDGASYVIDVNRWNGFYSLGFAWNAKNEEVLKNIDFLNDLKFRSSYGLTASQFPGNYNYISTYENTRYVSSGIVAMAPGNPRYDWELCKQLDFGLDFSIWKRRIRGVFDWYNRDTEDLFVLQNFSSTSGFPSILTNSGKMRNRGIEGDIAIDIISNKNWFFSLGGNFNYNKNTILDLGEATEYVTNPTIVREGLPFGSFYLGKWAGVDPKDGKPQYYKLDGTISNDYDLTSQGVTGLGTFQPPFQGGFYSSLKFRQFYADAFFTYAEGFYKLNNEEFFNESSAFAASNQSTIVLNRWRKEGDIANVQRFGTKRSISSKDVQDASYIRFRNLKVGYSLSKNVLSRIKVIQKASIFVQAQNLHTWTKWTGFDPEDNNTTAFFEYPHPKTYTLGFNVNF